MTGPANDQKANSQNSNQQPDQNTSGGIIRQNENMRDQENSEEDIRGEGLFGERGEKYLRDVANIEELPEANEPDSDLSNEETKNPHREYPKQDKNDKPEYIDPENEEDLAARGLDLGRKRVQ